MSFKIWLENEEVAMPDAKKVLYTAVILDKKSQDHLVSVMQKLMLEKSGGLIPSGWIGRCHHMTIRFKPSQADLAALSHVWGREVPLTVTDWAYDEYGVAVVVKSGTSLPLSGSVPHITVAHSRDVGPVYSNTLLTNRSNWIKMDNILSVVGLVGGVTGGNEVIPENPIPLATPMFSF